MRHIVSSMFVSKSRYANSTLSQVLRSRQSFLPVTAFSFAQSHLFTGIVCSGGSITKTSFPSTRKRISCLRFSLAAHAHLSARLACSASFKLTSVSLQHIILVSSAKELIVVVDPKAWQREIKPCCCFIHLQFFA